MGGGRGQEDISLAGSCPQAGRSEPSLWAGGIPSFFQGDEATFFHEVKLRQAANCSLLIWFPLISRNSLRA